MNRHRALLMILGLGWAVAATFAAGSVSEFGVEWRDILSAFLQVWPVLGLAIVFHTLGHGLRALRSRWLVQVIAPASLREPLRALFISFFINFVLPLRLGEFVRAHVLGRSLGMSRVVVFSSILMERLVDAAVLLVGGVFLGFYLKRTLGVSFPADSYAVIAGLVAFVIAGLAGFRVLLSENRAFLSLINQSTGYFSAPLRDRLRLSVWSAIFGSKLIFPQLLKPRYLAATAAMWFCYLFSVWLLIGSLIPNFGFAAQAALALAAYFGVSIPSGPAFIGTFHFFFSRNFLALGGAHAQALMVSTLVWFLLVVPASLIGFLVFAMRAPAANRHEGAEPGLAQFLPMMNKLHRGHPVSAELRSFLAAYWSGAQLTGVLSQLELADDFRSIKLFRGGSHATTLLAWVKGQIVIRKLALPQHAAKLRAQYAWLQARQNLAMIPKLLHDESSEAGYSFDMEYLPDSVAFFEYVHSHPVEASERHLDEVLRFLNEEIHGSRNRRQAPELILRYLDEKVIAKVDEASRLNSVIADLALCPNLLINAENYLGFRAIVQKIRSDEAMIAELGQLEECPIHGDVTIDNLIVADGEMILLDPNDENLISDAVVDVAKLYQSLHSGYEFLRELRSVEVSEGRIVFDEHISSRYVELFAKLGERLDVMLTPARRRAVIFHEAVHFF